MRRFSRIRRPPGAHLRELPQQSEGTRLRHLGRPLHEGVRQGLHGGSGNRVRPDHSAEVPPPCAGSTPITARARGCRHQRHCWRRSATLSLVAADCAAIRSDSTLGGPDDAWFAELGPRSWRAEQHLAPAIDAPRHAAPCVTLTVIAGDVRGEGRLRDAKAEKYAAQDAAKRFLDRWLILAQGCRAMHSMAMGTRNERSPTMSRHRRLVG